MCMTDDGPSKKVVYGASFVATVLGIAGAIAASVVLGNVIYGAIGGALAAGVGYKALELALTA